MLNLAFDRRCDAQIRSELAQCGIPAVPRPEGDVPLGDVPYNIVGRIGGFTFCRMWIYWMVAGRVTLSVAKEIYADPVGRLKVRVNGDSGCPAPGQPQGGLPDWFSRTTGARVLARRDPVDGHDAQSEWEEWKERLRLVDPEPIEWADDPAAVADPFITLYHIDSLEGLALFVRAIRDAGLVDGSCLLLAPLPPDDEP